MKRIFLCLFTICGLFSFSCAIADNAPLTNQEKKIQHLLKEKMDLTITSIKPIQMGLYEVVANKKPYYVDKDARFLISGNIYEINSKKNLTQIRIDELGAIDPKILPLEQAVITKKGDGSRTLYLFADPYCSYCKALEKTLETVDNITLYTFISPILDSEKMVDRILCSSNPEKVWREWMLKGVEPPKKGNCKNNWTKKNAILVDIVGLESAPCLYFEDGSRMEGASSKEEIEERFLAIEKAKKK